MLVIIKPVFKELNNFAISFFILHQMYKGSALTQQGDGQQSGQEGQAPAAPQPQQAVENTTAESSA